jgi:AmiR/NasT family two-component response regulator
VIDQAIGIIIGMQHCPPDVAFDVLRTVSQNRNIPLGQVAADLVTRPSLRRPRQPEPTRR